jgi:antitoxin CptB
MDSHEHRLKRLKFRAGHRGFVEADLILGSFVERHAASLTPAQLDDLERLLEENDHDIYAWVIGREPAPAEFQTEVLELIRAHRFSVHAVRPGLDG